MSDVAPARLRAQLERCVQAAIAAVEPARLVRQALARHSPGGRVHILAVGKAALPMLNAPVGSLEYVAALAVTPADTVPSAAPRVRVLHSDHPVPGPASVAAGAAVREFVARLEEADTLLVLLSGGASALMSAPAAGLTLDDLAATTRLLLANGADIHALNCVRKHLDLVKGGRLARLAAPASVLCLTLSDVPGDDPAVIGSGPFTADPTTFADARAVLERCGITQAVPAAVRAHLESARDESPKPGEPALQRVETHLIGTNRTALEAAAAAARDCGYTAQIEDGGLMGEARTMGEAIGRRLREATPGTALILGGETTVTVRGHGRGGRNQELALAAAAVLDGCADAALAAVGTDGRDGTSPAAGGIVDGSTAAQLRARHVDIERALADNDSFSALAAVDAALLTGPTGTNVMDVVIALKAAAAR